MFSERFEGKTIKEAEEAALADIPKEKIVSLRTIKDGENRAVAIKYGEEEAIKAAKASLLDIEKNRKKDGIDIFDIGPVTILEKGTRGIFEIEAFSEEEAQESWKTWNRNQPKSARLDELECSSKPSKGFAGIGKKKGLWKAHWSTPFTAEIKYRQPAVVEAKFEKEVVEYEENIVDNPSEKELFLETLFSGLLPRIESDNRLLDAKGMVNDLNRQKEMIIVHWRSAFGYADRAEKIAYYFVHNKEYLDKFCQLVLEIVVILQSVDYDSNPERIRKARIIGKDFVNMAGGTVGVMQLCYQIILVISPLMASRIDRAWNGIGGWMD
jgi:hypothetical protein